MRAHPLSGAAGSLARKISACGVLCSACPAYRASSKGLAYQRQVAEAWHRIFGLDEKPERISCGGCFGPDEELYHTSRRCRTRRCAQRKGFATCAECSHAPCRHLEKAQAIWDHVPQLATVLSHGDFARYGKPYCGHRRRISAARSRRGGPARHH